MSNTSSGYANAVRVLGLQLEVPLQEAASRYLNLGINWLQDVCKRKLPVAHVAESAVDIVEISEAFHRCDQFIKKSHGLLTSPRRICVAPKRLLAFYTQVEDKTDNDKAIMYMFLLRNRLADVLMHRRRLKAHFDNIWATEAELQVLSRMVPEVSVKDPLVDTDSGEHFSEYLRTYI
jgi:hypothetical protein